MKKIATLSFILLAAMASQSQAATISYLVDLFQTTPYNGDASADFGVSGAVTFVGGANSSSGGGNNTLSNVYTLGTIGTLTFTAPYGTYNAGAGSDTTAPGYLTKAYTFVDSFLPQSSNTFTLNLSSLPTGDTVSIAAIGGASGNAARSLISINGGTGILVDGASSSTASGTFTSLLTGGTATSYTLTQTSNHDSAYEGDLAGFLITVTPASVPEPSTWAMMLVGLGALVGFSTLRRRV